MERTAAHFCLFMFSLLLIYKIYIFTDDPQFNEVLNQAQIAIDHEVYPERIYQGSSGSYFVKNRRGVSLKTKEIS